MSALWGLDDLRKRSGRDFYISLLERRLGHPLPLTRDERDMQDIWRLVDSCLAYSGALHTLLSVIEKFHQGSVPMMEIRELVEELLPEPLLRAPERQELHRLVHAIGRGRPAASRPAAIQAFYRDAVGPFGPPLDNGITSLRGIVAQLEDVNVGTDGVPPLLRFIEDLAAHVDDASAAALHEWASRVADRLGLQPSAVHRLHQGPAGILPAGRTRTYLVIEFRPDGAVPDRFLTSVWLQFDGEHGAMLRCDDDDPLTFAGLPLLITELLTENDQVINRPTPELTVEFVLPRSLLGTPLDQLRITVDGLERRLGIEYPVVVRSLERLRRQAFHHHWRRKWNWLRDNPGEATVCWVTQRGQYGGESLYNMLLSEPSSVCVAMSFPPHLERVEPPDELRIGLQAGTPIVAWCREGRDPERFAAEFQELLDMGVLALPENVLTLRRQALLASDADSRDDHLGLHLTLIFDDADRLPEPYVRLNAPA
ncbi:effector-associated domain 2-containing protein [Actinomadura scrupuli]|uniref:VMAP-C domain-containing protein n=1 Tax=Actinomadura scrupuli TaxID=559629 RepID=UPI003D96C567